MKKKRGSIVLLKLAATDIDSVNTKAVPVITKAVPTLLNAEAPWRSGQPHSPVTRKELPGAGADELHSCVFCEVMF